jgi:hypothetical protein
MGRSPIEEKAKDTKFPASIQRANLDAYWARERGTVDKNLQEVYRALRICHSLHLPRSAPFSSIGPYPIEDTFSMMEATTGKIYRPW